MSEGFFEKKDSKGNTFQERMLLLALRFFIATELTIMLLPPSASVKDKLWVTLLFVVLRTIS